MSRGAGCAVAALAACMGAGGAAAESLVAARAIPVRTVIAAADLAAGADQVPGALVDPQNAIGRETRVTIFKGRPIRPGDLTEPTAVERNDVVQIRFTAGPLEITATGRALDRGARGDRVRVMNLETRSIVGGVVAAQGLVEAGDVR